MTRKSQIPFRTTGELKKRLEIAAAENRRSCNKEIEARLLASFDASLIRTKPIAKITPSELWQLSESERNEVAKFLKVYQSGATLKSLHDADLAGEAA